MSQPDHRAMQLQERDAALERWLKNEVAPTIDRHRADPSRAAPIDEAFGRLDAMMSANANKAR